MNHSDKQQNNYDDIINTKWPRPDAPFRVHMPLEKRAKIFLPFAALKGFEEEIEKKRKQRES